MLQRSVVLVAEQYPFTAERIIRCQRASKALIGHRALQKRRRELAALGNNRVVGEGRGVVVLKLPDLPTSPRHSQRIAPKFRQFGCAVGSVVFRHHPWRGSLKYRHPPGDLGQLGNNLHPAGTGSYHCDLFARQIDAVIPLRGVHEHALEVGQPGDIGQLQRPEQPDRADHHVDYQRAGFTAAL